MMYRKMGIQEYFIIYTLNFLTLVVTYYSSICVDNTLQGKSINIVINQSPLME